MKIRFTALIFFLSILFSLSASAASFTITNFNADTAFRSEEAKITANINNPNNNALTLKVSGTDLSNNNGIISPGSFSDINLNPNEQKEFTFKINIPEKIDLGDYKGSFVFTNSAVSTDSLTQAYILKIDDRKLNATRLDKCDSGVKGSLALSIEDPDSNDDFNPGEEIKVKAKVKNTGNKDLDTQVEAILFNVDENDDIARARSEVKEIRDGTREEFEFTVKIPTTEIDEEDEYILFVKAFEDPDRETLNCQQDFVKIDLDRRSSDVIIDKMSITPDIVECGQVIGVKIDVENIGKKDQDASVKIYNNILSISEVSNQIRLRDADKEEKDPKNEAVVSFDVKIPKDAKPGSYILDGEVVFDGSSKKTSKNFGVICDKEIKKIESEVVKGIKSNLVENNINVNPGSSFSLVLNLKNEGNSKAIRLDLNGIESFGDLISGDNLIQLKAGESKTVYFYIKVRDEVNGRFNGFIELNEGSLDSVLFNVNIDKIEKTEINYNLIVGIVIILVLILLLLLELINRKV